MFRFIKDYFLALVVLLLFSFYLSYFFTVGYQIVGTHRALINGKSFGSINFGIITFIIFAFLPIIMWRILMNSEVPLLKETLGARLLLSQITIVLTISLFISKAIFNSVAKSVMTLEKDFVLGIQGRVVLIEILSIGIPFIIFLYLTKKVVSCFLTKIEG